MLLVRLASREDPDQVRMENGEDFEHLGLHCLSALFV